MVGIGLKKSVVLFVLLFSLSLVSVADCEVVSVYEGNRTVNLINRECLVG